MTATAAGLSAAVPSTVLRPVSALLGEARPLTKGGLALVSVVAIVATGLAAAVQPQLALAVIVGTAASVAILRHPPLGVFALAALVPVISGLKRGVPIPGLRLSEVLVGGVAILVLAFAHHAEREKWRSWDWLLFLYAMGTVALPPLSLTLRNEPVTFDVVASMLLPLQFFLLYRAVRVGLRADEQRRFALKLLLLGSLVVSALAILQQLDAPGIRSLIVGITDSDALQSYAYETYARATGPFQHWHALAGYLLVIMLVASSLLLHGNKQILGTRMLLLVLSTATAALMLSVTFTSMIGVAVGAVLIGAWSGRLRATIRWGAVSAVVAAGAFGSYAGERIRTQYEGRPGSVLPETIATRLQVWQEQYIPGLAGHWITGYGPDLPPEVVWNHTESVYFTVLLRGGLPLLFVFIAGLAALTVNAYRIAPPAVSVEHIARGWVRPVALAFTALVCVSWIINLLYPYATSSGMPQPFWVLAGVVMAYAGSVTGVTPPAAQQVTSVNDRSRDLQHATADTGVEDNRGGRQ